jgi:hypothetical protein
MAKLVIRTKGLPVETLDLKKGVNRLGRSADNDFKIQHDTISRFHCEVEVLDESMWAHDLDSSNGTFVNDQPVDGRVQLETGSLLRLGDVTMEIQDAPAPVEAEAPPACTNHPALPASMICTQCHLAFCGSCIHVLRRSGGKVLRLCPACSGHCESIAGMNQAQKSLFGNLISKLFKKEPPKPFLE